MVVGSRRGSVHTVQGFCVSILPQVLQTWIFSIATWSAPASGAISASRFLIRCSAARRAERGPSPGNRASSWISRSISGPAMALRMRNTAQTTDQDTSEQLHAGRQRQAAGKALHLVLQHRLGLATAVGMGRDDQIFDDLLLVRLEQGVVDRHALEVALGAERHHDEATSGSAFDLDRVEFGLHRLHLGL